MFTAFLISESEFCSCGKLGKDIRIEMDTVIGHLKVESICPECREEDIQVQKDSSVFAKDLEKMKYFIDSEVDIVRMFQAASLEYMESSEKDKDDKKIH